MQEEDNDDESMQNIQRQIQQRINKLTLSNHQLNIIDERYRTAIQQYLTQSYNLDHLIQLSADIQSNDIIRKHRGAIGIRKILSTSEQIPLQCVIDSGIAQKIMNLIGQINYPQLQYEALWASINIISGTFEQCRHIVTEGFIDLIISLLSQQNNDIVMLAVWGIGNLAGQIVFRDQVLKQGGLKKMIKLAEKVSDIKMLQTVTWVVSNLCRGCPLPDNELIQDGIVLLCSIILSNLISEHQTLTEALWAISHYCQNSIENIENLLKTGIFPKVIEILNCDNVHLQLSAMKIVQNILGGGIQMIEFVLKYGILDQIQKILRNNKRQIRRQGCKILANLAKGKQIQVQIIFSHQPLMWELIKQFMGVNHQIKLSICQIFINSNVNGHPSLLYNFYDDNDIMDMIITLLPSYSSEQILVILKCIKSILQLGDKLRYQLNPFVDKIVKSGKYQIIEACQLIDNQQVYYLVIEIILAYFTKIN